MGSVVGGMFFFRFWLRSKERLFLIFALSFWTLGLERVILLLTASSDYQVHVYLLRLLASAMILYAVWDKNRRPHP